MKGPLSLTIITIFLTVTFVATEVAVAETTDNRPKNLFDFFFKKKKSKPKKTKNQVKTSTAGAVFPVAKCYGLKNKGGAGHFGASRRGKKGAHTGIDWYAPRNTPLRAPWAGEVVMSRNANKGKAGRMMMIQHDNGYCSVYMHMQKASIKGGRVRKGQQIGTVGNSGNASRQACHVHYELRTTSCLSKKRRRINPAKVFGCTHDSGK